jgi:hypothetical protein
MPSRPFTWDDVVEKFDQLVVVASTAISHRRQRAVRSLEGIQVGDRMAPVSRIHVD